MAKLLRKIRRTILRDEPGYYDMFENPGESYFAGLYLHHIREALTGSNLRPPLRILDAGCQAGRLAVPLASEGHRVTGVDSSGVGLRRARRHASEAPAELELVRADLAQWLPRRPAADFDVVLCAEVLYLRENHRQILRELIRVLRPGGLCFISHRPTGYYLAEAFQRKDWDAVRLLLSKKEGTLFGSYYNWQDREDLESLYPSLGVQLIGIRPIGWLSWLAVKPDDLPEPAQELLLQADLSRRAEADASGRYLLAIGRKSPHG